MLQFYRRLWLFLSSLLVILSLGCGLASRFSAGTEPEENLLATRTPLPTFTPTSPVQVAVVTLPPATEPPVAVSPIETPTPESGPVEPPTPEPVPTDTPLPELTPTETPEPPSPVEAAAPPPAEPPPPPPTEPPPPPPPAEPVAGANGVIGSITFREGRNTYGVGEKVFVKIEATNVEAGVKPFGILGLTTSNGGFQTSWSNSSLAANETFRHEDGLAFSAPGNYKMWLSICFSTIEVCQGPEGNWERFEPGLDVIVQ